MGEQFKTIFLKHSKALVYHYAYCGNIVIIFTRNRTIYLTQMYVRFKRAQSYYEKSKIRVKSINIFLKGLSGVN